MHVNVEPTNKCQLNCKYCGDRKVRPQGFMRIDKYEEILNMIPYPLDLRLFLSGEPLLHPDIDEFVFEGLERGHHILIHTNGMALGKTLSHTLVQMTNALPRVTMKFSIMEGHLPLKLKKNIEFIAGINNNMHLSLYNIGFKEVDWEDCPINVENRTPHNWIGTGRTKHEFKIPCGFLEDSVAIYWNGDVPVCCADLNGDTIIGNIFKDGWDKIVYRLDRLRELQEKREFVKECMECERYGKNPDYKPTC